MHRDLVFISNYDDRESELEFYLSHITVANIFFNRNNEELLTRFKDEKDILFFLETISNSLLFDQYFWLIFDDKRESMLKLINDFRFQHLTPAVCNRVNNIINVARLYTEFDADEEEKVFVTQSFIQDETKIRKCLNEKMLTTSMLSYDILLYNGLEDKNYDDFVNELFFLTSTNALLYNNPELYLENKELLKISKEIILSSKLEDKKDNKVYQKIGKRTLKTINDFQRL